MSLSVEFWSSVELGAFARALIRALRASGVLARHRFEVPEASYRSARGAVGRSTLRWRSYVSYPWTLHRQLRGTMVPDAIVVCTNTFYAPSVALHAAGGHVPVINWIFDLYPDVLVQAGTIRARGAIERALAALTQWTFKRAAANVFLGKKLRDYAERRYGKIPRSVVIPVGADAESFRTAAPRSRPVDAPVRALYSGNLGRMHETETIVDVLGRGPPEGWTLDFLGHGDGFHRLAVAAARIGATDRVRFGASLHEHEWQEAMKAADIALVTVKGGAEGLIMPSKTYSAMAAGQAILAVCPLESELADTVRLHDAGWVVQPGDSAALAAVLRGAALRPEELLEKRRNSFRAGHDVYAQTALTPLWLELLRSVVEVRRNRGL